MLKPRIIAFYLPQYHPVPENDEWWGKGFTEWTNVAKAKPLFRGHYQPHIPADLGFYDLRLPVIREQQADMARDAGIEGFCYWHYWFGNGKQLLEKPFQEILNTGTPDFPFCLGWANETWSTKSWHNKSVLIKDKILIEQIYSEEDYVKHFNYILPAFKDDRYITIDGKPLFVIFKPLGIPDSNKFIECWKKLAQENGLKGIHFVGVVDNLSFRKINETKFKIERPNNITKPSNYYLPLLNKGFDAVNSRGYFRAELYLKGWFYRIIRIGLRRVFKISFLLPIDKYKQRDINKYLYVDEDKWENIYPTIIPNWDRTPRSGRQATVYTESTPDVFKEQIIKCLDLIKNKKDEHKIIFLQSWNEWGEGNYVEPDLKYGNGFLKVLKDCIFK
ncbi:hypothetical protein FACS189450_09660 [Spirochaetia bacterium]|nr:hypothetical protein FACS189450_09660 [Spirochaetia bacterium]